MMQPLNRSERNRAFFNFLLLFVITVTLIITVVFFSIQVPFSHNEQLRKELSLLENNKELSQSFQTELTETVNLLRTLDSREVQPAAVNAQIDFKLNKMNSLIRNVPDIQNSLYLSVIENLASLKNAKNDLRDLNSKEKNVIELKQEIQQLKTEINQKDIQITSCRAQLGQLQ